MTGTKLYYPAASAMQIGSTLYCILKDHLGSASVVTDNTVNAAIVGETRYYAYGETRFSTGTMYTDKLFTGQRDTGLGIYDYKARFYSKLGRFLSPDSIIPDETNPQDWNRFSYGLNNPSRYTDPSGHMAVSDTNEAGCSGGGPACIINMYSGYDDDNGMMDSLHSYVRRHKDYDPVADTELTDEYKAIVSIAMFQVVVQDTPEDASLWDILRDTFPSAVSISIFGIINEGINMSYEGGGGGGGWSSGPEWTKKMLSESEVIAQGSNIREVDNLVRLYGGDVKGWKKMKGWDDYGQEWYWYYHPAVGRVKVKLK